jgi:hypothetical protein
MTRSDVVAAFAGFPARLAEAVLAAPEVLAAPGEWGPAEVVRHLIAVERVVWQARIADLAAVDDPHWSWTEPGLEPGFDATPLDAILAAFTAVRTETVATILLIDDEGWARAATHATHGVLDLAGLLRVANDHDREHLDGIARQA